MRLIRGFLWTYGSQAAVAAVQFVYAGVSSRQLDPDAFANYAIAWTSIALLTLVFSAGASQAAARLPYADTADVTGLLAFSLLSGIACGVTTAATSWLWPIVWQSGSSGATEVALLLSPYSILIPLSTAVSGVLLRLGRYRRLSLISTFAGLSGSLMGIALMAFAPSPYWLVLPPTLTAVVIVVVGLVSLRDRISIRAAIAARRYEASFRGSMAISGILTFALGNVSKYMTSLLGGPTALAIWNRAEAVSTTPLYQVQNSLMQVLYPELRPGVATRKRRSDGVAAIAWVMVPGAALLIPAMPILVPFVLGSDWRVASATAAVLLGVGALSAISSAIAGAIESERGFKVTWSGYLIGIVVAIASALILSTAAPLASLAWSYLIATFAVQLTHLVAGRTLFDLPALLRSYGHTLCVGAMLAAAVAVACRSVPVLPGIWLLIAATCLVAVLLFLDRDHVLPLRILRRAR